MSYTTDDDRPTVAVWKLGVGGAVLLAVVVVALFGLFAGMKGFGRYQKLQDARNRVRVSEIEIRNQAQRVKIAQQQAEIRLEESRGIRSSQDEIARTLTPLYVQFEMVNALKEIARSGNNNSVVFVPAGANGIPLVYDTGGNKVGLPKGTDE